MLGARCQVQRHYTLHLQVGAKCWRLGAGRANWLDAAARCAAQAAVLASVTTREEHTAVSSEHVTRVSSRVLVTVATSHVALSSCSSCWAPTPRVRG